MSAPATQKGAPTAEGAPTIPVRSPRRCYRLQVRDEAPFEQVTLGGHTFMKRSEPVYMFDGHGRAVRKPVEGIIEELTQAEVEAIRKAMAKTIVRSVKTPKGVLVRVEIFAPTEASPMDPETDVPVTPFLRMEEVEKPAWWGLKD